MKLRQLRIRNFGPIAEAVFTPGAPLVLLYGRPGLNGDGKTSFADAIRWLLTQRATGVPDRGEGQRALIRLGQEEMDIAGEWETSAGTITMRRKLGPKGAGAVGIPEQDKVVRDAASVFCHGEAFLEEDLEKQKAVFLAAVDPKVSLARVADAVPLDEAPKELGVWPPPEGQDPATVFLRRGDIAKLFMWADEVRKQIGRDLKAAVPPAVDWKKIPGGKPDLKKLEAALDGLRADERQQTLALGAAIGQAREAQDQLRKVIKRSKELEAKTTVCKQHPDQLWPHETARGVQCAGPGRSRFRFTDQSEYTAAIRRLETEMREQRTAYDEWAEGKAAIEEERRRLADELTRLTTGSQGLSGLGAECVIHASIPCPLAKKDRSVALTKMTTRREEIEERLPTLTVPEAPTDPEETRRDLEALRHEYKEAAGYAEQSRAIGEEVNDLVRKGAKVSEVLDAEMQVAKEPNGDASIPAELRALRERITNGESTVRKARDLLDEDARHAAALTAQESAQKRQARYEAACKYLGASGVMERALAEGLEAVLAWTNQFLAPWDWRVQLKLDPFLLALEDGRPIGRLSKAERWWVGAALALASAVTAGWKTVVLDGADQLASENRGKLTRMVRAATDAGLLVILTGVPAGPLPAKAPPGVEVWAVEAGTLRKVA